MRLALVTANKDEDKSKEREAIDRHRKARYRYFFGRCPSDTYGIAPRSLLAFFVIVTTSNWFDVGMIPS